MSGHRIEVCQYGTRHRRCRCKGPHREVTIACPDAVACAKARMIIAPRAPLVESLSPVVVVSVPILSPALRWDALDTPLDAVAELLCCRLNRVDDNTSYLWKGDEIRATITCEDDANVLHVFTVDGNRCLVPHLAWILVDDPGYAYPCDAKVFEVKYKIHDAPLR